MSNCFKKYHVVYFGGHPSNKNKAYGCTLFFKESKITLTSTNTNFKDIDIPYNKIVYMDVTEEQYYNIVLKYLDESFGIIKIIFSAGNALSKRKNRINCIDMINIVSTNTTLNTENKDILIHKLQPITNNHPKFQLVFSNQNRYVHMMLYNNSYNTLIPITISFLKTGVSINRFGSPYVCENFYYIKYEDVKTIEINKIIDNSGSLYTGLSKKVSLRINFLNNLGEDESINIVSSSFSQAELDYNTLLSLIKNHFIEEKLIVK